MQINDQVTFKKDLEEEVILAFKNRYDFDKTYQISGLAYVNNLLFVKLDNIDGYIRDCNLQKLN